MYTGGQGNYPRPPKKNNGVMVALIVIAVLLVIVVALLVVYLVKDKEPAQQETQNTEVVETKTVNIDTTATTPAVAPHPKAPEPPEMAKERMRRPLEGNYSMSGSVGKYGVVMQLNIDGNYISGKYRYTRMKGAGGWLTISGERSGGETQGELYFSEYNDMGENCGNWSGMYHLNGNKLAISGSMINYKGTTYSFNLSGK